LANPVQPSSSKKPTASAPATLNIRNDAVPLIVTILGRNTGEASESARCTAVNTTGAVRSATAYQRVRTRHRSRLESNSRKPVRPDTTLVKRSAAVLSPASIATKKNGNRGSDCHVSPNILQALDAGHARSMIPDPC
jgi:hypothetical protein